MVRLAIPLAALALPSLAPAFILIDDFTDGGYTETFATQDFSRLEIGLDRRHAVLGSRLERLSFTNPDRHEVTVKVGGGEVKVTYPFPLASQNFLSLGAVRDASVDLSAMDAICFDVYTEQPTERFADFWSVTIENSQGRGATNSGWERTPTGIRFRRSRFTQNIDWSSIISIGLRQDWNFNNGRPSLTYGITKAYAVSEPATLLGAIALAAAFLKKKAGR